MVSATATQIKNVESIVFILASKQKLPTCLVSNVLFLKLSLDTFLKSLSLWVSACRTRETNGIVPIFCYMTCYEFCNAPIEYNDVHTEQTTDREYYAIIITTNVEKGLLSDFWHIYFFGFTHARTFGVHFKKEIQRRQLKNTSLRQN